MSFGGFLVFFGKCLLQWSHQIWNTCVVSKPESIAISSPSKKEQLATFLWSTYWHHPIQFSYQVKKNGQPTAYLDSLSRLIDLVVWGDYCLASFGNSKQPSLNTYHGFLGVPIPSFSKKRQGSAEEETEERGLSFTFELPNKTTKVQRGRSKGGHTGFQGEVLASQGTNTHGSFVVGTARRSQFIV